MTSSSTKSLVEALVVALQGLPGIGPKSAKRLTYTLLTRQREAARTLARVLQEAADKVGHCGMCRNLTELPECAICSSPDRQAELLCVVETPADVEAVEHSGSYQGRYFVLMGHLSPLDGIGPAQLGIDELIERLDKDGIGELILATNSTVEGEATARYIADLAGQRGVTCTRIAQGVPMGGEIEFADDKALRHAFKGRHGLTD